MAVMKRQRADGTWEYVQSVGQKVLTEEDLKQVESDLKSHANNNDIHVTKEKQDIWNNKQDALDSNQTRPIYVQTAEPSSPSENDIWIEVE